MEYKRLLPGDLAPFFVQRTPANPRYNIDTAAGRYLVFCFYLTAGDAGGRQALEVLTTHRQLFDDEHLAFFGISSDPQDEQEGRVLQQMPGIRHIWDFDGTVGRLYGALPLEAGKEAGMVPARRFWIVLDPAFRVIANIPFREDGKDRDELIALIQRLEPVGTLAGRPIQAPILVLPNIFEPEFCRGLIDLYEKDGGTDSGFMREVDGKTVGVQDYSHKRRADYTIEDETLIQAAQARFTRRVVPQIQRAYQFKVTRMERYIVACYDAATGGHFRAHRDNTTKGTAHRRFAVSVNLNEDFEGGEVSFPEYGPKTFKPPMGGAVVFSCSLLHAVSPMTKGKRYAFLPFLYDDEAAAIREANNKYLSEAVPTYSQTTG